MTSSFLEAVTRVPRKRRVSPAETNRQLTLADGRTVCYVDLGAPQGRPLFYCHGWPSCRLEALLLQPVLAPLGIRVIGIDRPGFGQSTFQPKRRLADWPADLAAVADALQLDRFAVLGASGGAPYAAACAHALPHRVRATALVSGLGPLDSAIAKTLPGPLRWSFQLCRKAPFTARLSFALSARRLRRNPQRSMARRRATTSEPDRTALIRPQVEPVLAAADQETYRPGVRGAVWEGGLYARPWGFRLEDIPGPVHIWHGGRDTMLPLGVAHDLHQRLPRGKLHLRPEAGHLSLLVDESTRIVESVLV